MLKFYKSMTLLNTMDRILYESQRQVRGGGLRRARGRLGSPGPCSSHKTALKEESEVEIFCLGVLKVLGVLLGLWRKSVGRAQPKGKRMDRDH